MMPDESKSLLAFPFSPTLLLNRRLIACEGGGSNQVCGVSV